MFHEYDAGAKSLAGRIQTEVIEKSSNFGIARNGSHALCLAAFSLRHPEFPYPVQLAAERHFARKN